MEPLTCAITSEPTGRETGRALALADGRAAACDCCSVGHGAENRDAFRVGSTALCVADGMNGAPHGALFAQLACAVAVDAADAGSSAREAAERAAARVRDLCADCRIDRGGAALLVARAAGDGLDVAWLGDVVAFVLRGQGQGCPDNPEAGEACGAGQTGREGSGTARARLERVTAPHRVDGRLARAAGPVQHEPSCVHVALRAGDRLAVLTDGVWEQTAPDRIAGVLARAATPRAATSALVLGRDLPDDATALVLFV